VNTCSSNGFGNYLSARYDKFDCPRRHSEYVEVRDGTKLAVDIYLPCVPEKLSGDQLPFLLAFTCYHRAFVQEGKIYSLFDPPMGTMFSYLIPLMESGYGICVVDVRGTGASFGHRTGILTSQDRDDTADIIEWLGTHPLCNGRIGMFGVSFLGMMQYLAASTESSYLKAIFPQMAPFDFFDFVRPGGVFRKDLIQTWSGLTKSIENMMLPAPVDNDTEQKALQQALEEHRANVALIDSIGNLDFRDSKIADSGISPYIEWSLSSRVDEINKSQVAVYIWSGWYDLWTKDAVLWFSHLSGTKKFTVGNWSHNPMDPELMMYQQQLLKSEHLRWFDYWLKGIDTGIMNEAPLAYALCTGTTIPPQWRFANRWPVEANVQRMFFSAEQSGTIKSCCDGKLDLKASAEEKIHTFFADYEATTGLTSRFDNGVGGQFGYGDLQTNDSRGATYTSDKLSDDFVLIGHPVVHIFLKEVHGRISLFVYLEKIYKDGFSEYVSEGCLNARYRKSSRNEKNDLGIQVHLSNEHEIKNNSVDLAGDYVIDLQPMAYIFEKGSRIRVTITCADKDNAYVEVTEPASRISLTLGGLNGSCIFLPKGS